MPSLVKGEGREQLAEAGPQGRQREDGAHRERNFPALKCKSKQAAMSPHTKETGTDQKE